MNPPKKIPHAIITAGPTFEPLDQVRRLTNFSTGSLGAQLACYLKSKGVKVTLLTGYYVTYEGPFDADDRIPFTTTEDLAEKLKALSGTPVDAVFHAAAVSDYAVGAILEKKLDGSTQPVKSRKISTRQGTLLAELLPTPKILRKLREWFPHAFLTGWKYELEGSPSMLAQKAVDQIRECQTNLCVLNGPCIGTGFEIYASSCSEVTRMKDRKSLFERLWRCFSEVDSTH